MVWSNSSDRVTPAGASSRRRFASVNAFDRLIKQATRSETGNRWCERIWTVIATCTQQGRWVFEYLEAAVGAWFAGTEPPLLLPGV